MNVPVEASADQFCDVVKNRKELALACFWSEWSPPCREMEDVIADIYRVFKGDFEIFIIDPDTLPLVAAQYEIVSIPTFVLFDGGEERARMVGVRPYEDVEQMVLRYRNREEGDGQV